MYIIGHICYSKEEENVSKLYCLSIQSRQVIDLAITEREYNNT